MTTRSLVSLICDPLRRYKRTSKEFPALFLSFCLISLLFSPPTLSSVVFFYLSLTRVSSQRSFLFSYTFFFFCPPPFLTRSPLLLALRSHSSFFLPPVSLLLKRSPPVSLSLFLFLTVVHDFPAD